MATLLARFRLWHKFAAIGALTSVLFGLPLYLYISEAYRNVETTSIERNGIAFVRPLLPLRKSLREYLSLRLTRTQQRETEDAALQDKRRQVSRYLQAFSRIGEAEVDHNLKSIWRKVRADWTLIADPRHVRGDDDVRALLNTIDGLLGEAIDRYKLTLDSEVDTYYLANASLQQLPALMAGTDELRAQIDLMFQKDEISISDRRLLALAYTTFVIERTESAYLRVFNANQAIRNELQESYRHALSATRAAYSAVEELTLGPISEVASMRLEPMLSLAGQSLYDLTQSSLSSLDQRLADRISRLRNRVNYVLAGVLSLFAIVLGAVVRILANLIAGINKPLHELVRATEIVSSGNLDHRCRVEGAFELTELSRHFNFMLDRLNNSTAELARSQAHLHAVFDHVVDGIVTVDDSCRIESFNRGAEQLFSYGAHEVVGKHINVLMPEPYFRNKAIFDEKYPESQAADRVGKLVRRVGRRKDGSRFSAELIFNRMTLQGHRYYVGLVRDVSERERLEKLKNEFVSTVSHELRTPLTSIRGSLGLLLGGVGGDLPEQAKKLIAIASNNSERLVRLINDILDMEKIESGKMAFEFRPQTLMPLLESGLEANRGFGDQFGVRFELQRSIPDVIVNVDIDRFMQIMTNLLSNAAKFSPTGGTVTVNAELKDEKHVRIAVTDRGPGIPEKFKHSVFEKFAQADSSDSRNKGGTGLGLSITKALVERMGGQLNFNNEVDAGTTFYFDIPLVTPAKEAELSAAKGSDKRVLVCEDDPDIARLIALMLGQRNIHCDIAHSAEEAKVRIAGDCYSAITVDLKLPQQDGLSLIRDLRSNKATRELPVVVISAASREGKQELNGAGFPVVDWLDKPIDETRLMSSINVALTRHRDRPARILHIEDDGDVQTVVAAVVGDLAEVIPVGSIETATELLNVEQFDLAILDVGLPDGSGLSLIPLLNKQCPPVPAVIFSAYETNPETAAYVAATMVKARTSNDELFDTIASLVHTNARELEVKEELRL